MRTIDTVYIDGQFVTPHGAERFDLFNPPPRRRRPGAPDRASAKADVVVDMEASGSEGPPNI